MSVKEPRRPRRRVILGAVAIVLVVAVTGFVVLSSPQAACAHSPHDPIDGLALSPEFADDQTAFIAIRDVLLRSTDGGWEWQQLWNGLTHVAPFSGVVVSPAFGDDATVFATTEGDGVFRSTDGGETWSPSSTGMVDLRVEEIALSPTFAADDEAAALTADGTLHLSQDGGATWFPVDTGNDEVTALGWVDVGRLWIGSGGGLISELVDGGPSDFGRIDSAGAITVIAGSLTEDRIGSTVFVGTQRGGVFRTLDGGATFEDANNGLSDAAQNDPDPDEINVQSIAISANAGADGVVLLSAKDRAPFLSRDGGSAWAIAEAGVTCDDQPYGEAQYADAPQFRELAISNGFAEDGTVFLAGFDGLFRTSDQGERWVQVETLPVGTIKGLDVSGSTAIGLATYGGGAYVGDESLGDWVVANEGLITTRLVDIAFSPDFAVDDVLYSGSSGRMLISKNAGASWDAELQVYTTWKERFASAVSRTGLPTRWMLTDQERARPYPTAITLSPAFTEDDTLFWGTRKHGVYRSSDGGQTAVPSGLDEGAAINSVVMSPAFATDQTVFATVFGRGVYKSDSGGHGWSQANDGLDFLDEWQAEPILSDTRKAKMLLAISPDFERDQMIYVASSAGLYRSTDGGGRWSQLGTDEFGSRYRARAIALSPAFATDRTLILSVRGEGLFKSADGGETFSEIGRSLIEDQRIANFLAFSPRYDIDQTIVAASAEGLFVSTNGGATWEVVGRPVRYENHREVVEYGGNWETVKDVEASASSVTVLREQGSRASLRFVGTGVTLIGSRGTDGAAADVYLDGALIERIDRIGDQAAVAPLFSLDGLVYGAHTIEVVLVNGALEVDAFDIDS